MMRSHSQEQFSKDKTAALQIVNYQQLINQKKQVQKMIYHNNFSLRDVSSGNNLKLAQDTTHSVEFTRKSVREPQLAQLICSTDLQQTHFTFGSEKPNFGDKNAGSIANDNTDAVQMKGEQVKRKEKMRKHNFMLGYRQQEEYRTSNEIITKNTIPVEVYASIKQDKEHIKSLKEQSFKFRDGTFSDLKEKFQTPPSTLTKPNFHYTQTPIQKGEKRYKIFKGSSLTFGNYKNETKSQSKATYVQASPD